MTTALEQPAGNTLSRPADLTFLLHAAANRMTVDIDAAATRVGLKDARDWLLLTALADGQPRTQLELSRAVHLDKTTMVAVLNRLQQRQLVTRAVDPSNRRTRIPRITPAGLRVYEQLTASRDDAETGALAGIDSTQRTLLISLLTRVAHRPVGNSPV